MKSTRQRLLDYLKTHRTATAEELGHALQVTAADARHHLGVLSAEGAVQAVGERPGRGRGRPAQLYGLAKGRQGDSLDRLTHALLAEMLAETSSEMQNACLRRIADRLAGDTQSSSALTPRLLLAMRKLNELGYAARWEAHASAPQIILGNCPYATILNTHPELCQMDGFLLEKLIGAPLLQTVRLEREARGGRWCRFEVG